MNRRTPRSLVLAGLLLQDAERSAAADMDGDLTKPLDPERLLTLLGRYRPVRAGAAPATAAPPPAPGRSADLTPEAAPDVHPGVPHDVPEPLPADLAALTRFAAAEGVRRIGGHVAAYRRQLLRFRAHYADAPAQLRQRLARDPHAAFEYVHSLKGVTGNLGAKALFDRCTALQGVLQQGQTPDAAALAEGPAVASEPPPVPLTADEQDRLLADLATALEFDLGAAEPLLARLRAALAGTPTAAAVAEIAVLVDRFDTDEALQSVNALRGRVRDQQD